VNVGSIWAVVSKKGRGLYSAVKNGLHGITNTLALELGEYNVLVNTVCPGFTLTELTKKNNAATEIQQISDKIPLKRMAKPEEIAEFIFFLCSDNNTYITGQKICIDGGFTVQ
jgi:3-oxoacyl-[acyl-carrier protein] reductase